MHKGISAFPNKTFYEGRLRDAPSTNRPNGVINFLECAKTTLGKEFNAPSIFVNTGSHNDVILRVGQSLVNIKCEHQKSGGHHKPKQEAVETPRCFSR